MSLNFQDKNIFFQKTDNIFLGLLLMSKPGKVLRNICKKLGIRLTVKRGQKRVYKSIAVLKRQCANKKVKRKRRRKFGSVKKLQMISTEAVVDDLIKQIDDENSETFEQSFDDLGLQMIKTGYPDYTLDMFVKKFVDKKYKIIEREKFEKYYNAWKKFLQRWERYGLKYKEAEDKYRGLNYEIRDFKKKYQENNRITWYEIERFHGKINKIEKEKYKKRERERKEIEEKEYDSDIDETKEGEIDKAVAAKRRRSRINNNRSSGSSNSKSGFYRNVYSPRIGLGLLIVVVILGLGGTGTFFLVKALGKEEDKRKRKRKK